MVQLYCTPQFKKEYLKLLKSNSYSSLQDSLVNLISVDSVSQLCTGTRLNNSNEAPFIKKRLVGSGGFRLYYFVMIIDNKAYLGFVHPKTGALGYESITNEKKKDIQKEIADSIAQNTLLTISVRDGKVVFEN